LFIMVERMFFGSWLQWLGMSVVALGLLAWGGLAPTPALAQGVAEAGIGIKPAVYEPNEKVDPGTSKTFSLTVTNHEAEERELFLTPRNISGMNESGRPLFSDEEQELTGYELASWIELGSASLVVPANGTREVVVTIRIPEDAPPGSHFGGINISADAPRLRESGAGISYGVSNIVTVLVDGDINEAAIIRSLSTSRYLYGGIDVTFEAQVENQGNTLLRPVGPLEVTNMFGSKVATLTMNESQAGVFPDFTRTFQLEWQDQNPGLGKYQAVLSLAYGSDGSSQTMTSTVSFWVLPLNIVLPALGGLVLLLLVTYIAVRIYVRRAISHHSGGARRVKGGRRSAGLPLGLLLLIVMLVVTALFLLILLALVA
jgi:hypothetical protein